MARKSKQPKQVEALTHGWQTSARHSHVNWAVCDSDWEAEFCRLVESHPRVSAYAKNHGLGFEADWLANAGGSAPDIEHIPRRRSAP